MKNLIATVLALSTLNSFAASIPVFETTNHSILDGAFGINEEMGRAWVEVSESSTFSSDDSGPAYSRVKVPGLSIVAGSVVLDVEGQQFECAKIRPVGIFRYRVAKATGNCHFKTKVETRISDDGFETRKQTVRVLLLNTK
jgi:hypothetical protein